MLRLVERIGLRPHDCTFPPPPGPGPLAAPPAAAPAAGAGGGGPAAAAAAAWVRAAEATLRRGLAMTYG